MTVIPRSSELLDRERSRLLLIDMQDRLLSAIPHASELVESARLLAAAAALLGVPVDLSEQYPHGLGATAAALRGCAAEPISKLRFSAADACSFSGASEVGVARDQIVLAGIEAHVCVLQTALDLIARGYRVFVVVDAVGSRRAIDQDVALQRLRDSGVTLTTAESVAFEWCVSADDPQFKAVSSLVKVRSVASTAAAPPNV